MSSKIYPPAMGTQIDYSVFVRVCFVCCSRAQAKYLLTNTVVAHGGDATKDLYTATISQEPALLHYYNNTRPQSCFPISRQPTLFSRLYGLHITRVALKTLHSALSQATSLLPPLRGFSIFNCISSSFFSFYIFWPIRTWPGRGLMRKTAKHQQVSRSTKNSKRS